MLVVHGLGLLVTCVLVCALLTGLTRAACRRCGLLADRVGGVQNLHRHWAPRLGGLPIFATLAIAALAWDGLPERRLVLLLLVCALPAFLAGLVEDLWHKVGPRARLVAAFVSAWLAWFLIGGQLTRVDLPGFDFLLSEVWIFAFLFTAFAVGGVAHSINIIDGFNGLSGFYCAICCVAFFIVATLLGDALIQSLALLLLGALLGFLVWNFPFGRVFLGDAGAYFVGFALGEMSVLLVARNPEVSPWFCFLLMAYPIWDTLFSSYRREVKRERPWSMADALHLHHLIHRRLVRPFDSRRPLNRILGNSLTSIYVWSLGLICAIPAVMFRDSTPTLVLFVMLFGLSYGLLYRRLVRFRAPRLLMRSARPPVARIDDQSIPAK